MDRKSVDERFDTVVADYTKPQNMEARKAAFKKTYKYVKGLGGGAEGEVRLMKHVSAGQLFAVKKMDQRFLPDRTPKPPHELKILNLLTSTGTGPGLNTIVYCLDWYPCTPRREVTQIIMPYCRLGDLFSWISEQSANRQALWATLDPSAGWTAIHEAQMRHIYLSIARGLAFLHFGAGTTAYNPATNTLTGRNPIIHRDIKPQNVLVSPAPASRHHSLPTVRLADFGGAAELGAPPLDHPVAFFTKEFVAPEFMGRESKLRRADANMASDVWAAGATIHWCLFGRSPYRLGPGGLPQMLDCGKIEGLSGRLGAAYSNAFEMSVSLALTTDVGSRYNALQLVQLLEAGYDAHMAAYTAMVRGEEDRERRLRMGRLHEELLAYHRCRAGLD